MKSKCIFSSIAALIFLQNVNSYASDSFGDMHCITYSSGIRQFDYDWSFYDNTKVEHNFIDGNLRTRGVYNIQGDELRIHYSERESPLLSRSGVSKNLSLDVIFKFRRLQNRQYEFLELYNSNVPVNQSSPLIARCNNR